MNTFLLGWWWEGREPARQASSSKPEADAGSKPGTMDNIPRNAGKEQPRHVFLALIGYHSCIHAGSLSIDFQAQGLY
jgi:hypothetical protein